MQEKTSSRLVVLIPFYNDLKGLRKSLNSINDECRLDIVIVDDGSKKALNSSELDDIVFKGNIELIRLDINVGIENALNAGLKYIQSQDYDYIGRLDCGDTCVANRFTKQINYLDLNPNINMLGTWANYINEDDERFLYVMKTPVTYIQIKNKMIYNNCFVHPSVVFRSNILDEIGLYPTKYKYAEDYAFFFKMVHFGVVENYPEALVNYYLSENSISSNKRKQQIRSRIRIINNFVPFSLKKVISILRNTLLLYTSREFSMKIKKFLGIKI